MMSRLLIKLFTAHSASKHASSTLRYFSGGFRGSSFDNSGRKGRPSKTILGLSEQSDDIQNREQFSNSFRRGNSFSVSKRGDEYFNRRSSDRGTVRPSPKDYYSQYSSPDSRRSVPSFRDQENESQQQFNNENLSRDSPLTQTSRVATSSYSSRSTNESSQRPLREDRSEKYERNDLNRNRDNRNTDKYSSSDDGRGRHGRSDSSGRVPANYRSTRNDPTSEPSYGYFDGDHLFGISPVYLALKANRRNITELLIQSGMDVSNKKSEKTASEILRIAKERNIQIREFSKQELNRMTENKVHQGFVLRAEPLEFTKLTHLEPTETYSCVLALDEVWDPMNFGALVRTSYFLGVDKVVICAKNSAPLSPTVSKASAGSVELMEIYSTNNLMKFLDKSVENGWQVVGADLGPTSIPLTTVPLSKPTILVLGNEGHGIRTNVKNRCTHLVRIASGGGGSGVASTDAGDANSNSTDAAVTIGEDGAGRCDDYSVERDGMSGHGTAYASADTADGEAEPFDGGVDSLNVKTNCPSCGKATWAGCGMHIDSALSGVAIADRCAGWETGKCPNAKPGDKGSKDGPCKTT